MVFFGKGGDKSEPVSPAPTFESKSGAISLKKGEGVSIRKTKVIRAKASWSSNTDYDLYALILTRDGKVHTVAQFGTKDDPGYTTSVLNGAVRHLGDVGRTYGGTAEEIIEITLTPEIVAVVPIAYSAQSNGTGSFHKYGVNLSIDDGEGTTVSISSENASKSSIIYTVAIGIIRNTDAGVTIEALEKYSRRMSERRPTLLADGTVSMDSGAYNLRK